MRTIRLFGIIPVIVSAACVSVTHARTDDPEVRLAVTRALNEHATAAVRQDVASAASMFAVDARIMLPGISDVWGRDSIASIMRKVWPAIRPVEVAFNTQEVYALGDMAVSVGTYDFLLEPKGQGKIRDTGRFMLLWKRQGDGSWRVYRDLTNSALSAPVPVSR